MHAENPTKDLQVMEEHLKEIEKTIKSDENGDFKDF